MHGGGVCTMYGSVEVLVVIDDDDNDEKPVLLLSKT